MFIIIVKHLHLDLFTITVPRDQSRQKSMYDLFTGNLLKDIWPQETRTNLMEYFTFFWNLTAEL